MKLRTQLSLACILLAVVPLSVIVLYTYHSSRTALEKAQLQETARQSRQMDRRLSAIRADLDDRLTKASDIQLAATANGENPMLGDILDAIGDVAPLVEALEFQPVAKPQPKAVADAAPPAEALAKSAEALAEKFEDFETIAPESPEAPVTPEVRVPLNELEPIVIDIPRVPRFELPPEQSAKVNRIGELSAKLQTLSPLDAEEHAKIKKELRTLSAEVDVEVDRAREAYQRKLEVARVQQANLHAQIRKRHEEERRRIERRQAAANDHTRRSVRTVVGVSVSAVAPPATPAVASTAPAPAPATPASQPEIKRRSELTAEEQANLKNKAKQTRLIIGRKLNAPVKKDGAVVGQITAQVRPEEVIRRVLGPPSDDGSELAFALDREGNLYTRSPQEREMLTRLGIPKRTKDVPGWIVAQSVDEESGMRVGVARPVGENLEELRRTAARNFSWGLGLIFIALIGVVPFANHLTRDVQVVTDGAERIAQGDLMTRLPVKSKNEIGQLAVAFNRMAEDLSVNQQRLLEQERARKEQELQQRLLALEYDRKTVELEEARRFQLSMLPKELPQHERFDVAVFTQTATEVGGDYYDFHQSADGAFSVAIGDAVGHGAKAGTMVTVVKTLFAAYGAAASPASFLRDAAEKIKRMELGRMSMALSLGRFEHDRLTIASAGMPPVLIRRATGVLEEIAIGATPLGTLGADYREETVAVASGDTILFLTDGLPELLNSSVQQLGYAAAQDIFAEAAAQASDAASVIARLAAAAEQWHGEQPPNDDVTFVVVRVR